MRPPHQPGDAPVEPSGSPLEENAFGLEGAAPDELAWARVLDDVTGAPCRVDVQPGGANAAASAAVAAPGTGGVVVRFAPALPGRIYRLECGALVQRRRYAGPPIDWDALPPSPAERRAQRRGLLAAAALLCLGLLAATLVLFVGLFMSRDDEEAARVWASWTGPDGARLQLVGPRDWSPAPPLPPAPDGPLPAVEQPLRQIYEALRALDETTPHDWSAALERLRQEVDAQGWRQAATPDLLRVLHALSTRSSEAQLGGAAAALGLMVCELLAARGEVGFLPYLPVFVNSPWIDTRLRARRAGSYSDGGSIYMETLASQVNRLCLRLAASEPPLRSRAAAALVALLPTLRIWDPSCVYRVIATGEPEATFRAAVPAFSGPRQPACVAHLLAVLARLSRERPDCQAFWEAQARALLGPGTQATEPPARDPRERARQQSAARARAREEAFSALFVAQGLVRSAHPQARALVRDLHAARGDAERAALGVLLRRLGEEPSPPPPEEASPFGAALGVVLSEAVASPAERAALEGALTEPYPFHGLGVPDHDLLAERARALLAGGRE